MRDSGYDYIINRDSYYSPKTPYTALKAALEGMLPVDAYTFMATSIEAIADDPENLQEIERITGQKTRDLDTNLLLTDVLGKLTRNPDKEIALFAAESITAIENSYNRKLERLDKDEHRERAVLYYEMAALHRDIPDLRNFYLYEAFSAYRILEKEHLLTREDRFAMGRILIELGLYAQAKMTITDNIPESPDSLFFLAEIAFIRRDMGELSELIVKLDRCRNQLDSEQSMIIDSWMGRS